MDTRALDKIHSRYNGDHDIGPDAPVHWSVEELAWLVGKLVQKVEELEAKVQQLEGG
jgi:hypothetical protein